MYIMFYVKYYYVQINKFRLIYFYNILYYDISIIIFLNDKRFDRFNAIIL